MNILFDLLIFSLPFGVISRINVYPNVYVYLHDIIVFLIFINFAFRLFTKREHVENKNLLKYFLAFLCVGFLSLVINARFLTSHQFFVSLLYAVRFLMYGSLLFTFPRSSAYLKSLNLKLIISGVIFILFGYIQYFYYPDLKNLIYAGWDEHLYRMFSSVLDPNFAGMVMVLISILLLGNLLDSFKNKINKSAVVFGLLSILSLGGVYFTYSRSAFIALLVGIGYLLYSRRQVKIIYPVVILLIIVLFIFSNPKVEGLNLFRKVSSIARINSINNAVYVVQKNPILGVGFNAYRYAQVRYGLRTKESLRMSNADAGADNSYLFVLATTGIVGYLLFARFLLELIKLLSKNTDKNVISMVALPSLLALLVNTLFINSLFYTLILTWVFLLIGVTVSKKQ